MVAELAAIAEQQATGVINYIHDRCIPGKSYKLAGEKPMNDINYSYQNVTVKRNKGTPELELLLTRPPRAASAVSSSP